MNSRSGQCDRQKTQMSCLICTPANDSSVCLPTLTAGYASKELQQNQGLNTTTFYPILNSGILYKDP